MDDEQKARVRMIFADRIIYEHSRAISSFSQIEEECLAQHPNVHRIHLHLDTWLDAFSKVSLFFFPALSKKNYGGAQFCKDRAEILRGTFHVPDDSLFGDRNVRNHIAHFDERIDRWICESEEKTYGCQMVGKYEVLQRLGLAKIDILGFFDVETFLYYFGGDVFPVDLAMCEFREVCSKVRRYQILMMHNRLTGGSSDPSE